MDLYNAKNLVLIIISFISFSLIIIGCTSNDPHFSIHPEGENDPLSVPPEGENEPPFPGPVLLSESDTVDLAREQAGIQKVISIDMATAGPIYRVVIGEDAHGSAKAVWVSDQIVFVEELANGISREEARQKALDRGFNDDDKQQLVYMSSQRIAHQGMRNPSGNVFWWFSAPDEVDDADSKHIMFIDFYTGEIVFEWLK